MLAAYGNVNMQSFYGSWEKRGFVKVAVSRAALIRLQRRETVRWESFHCINKIGFQRREL